MKDSIFTMATISIFSSAVINQQGATGVRLQKASTFSRKERATGDDLDFPSIESQKQQYNIS
jgi:hypothetical protein